MANGKQRDSVGTDIVLHRIPTLSPEVDECFRQLARLSDTTQAEQLRLQVERWLKELDTASVSSWLSDPSMYLAELEPQRVSELGETLKQQLAARRRDAQQRGWKVG